MDHEVTVAIITAATAVSVAILSFFLNEHAKRKAEWQQKKFGHYQELLQSLSELAVDGKSKHRANLDFSAASNTVVLIASQEVITALMLFHNEVKWTNKENFSLERHDKLLQKLVLAIRQDVGLSKKDDPTSFDFHLIGSGPQK